MKHALPTNLDCIARGIDGGGKRGMHYGHVIAFEKVLDIVFQLQRIS
jgi:hypothetical protein